ncbi:MAG TPA: PilZ domain-containing protein [Longimicrobiales bacterium]|nr:PilZ domain-containing protein [Longimicrobiales bacterium]
MAGSDGSGGWVRENPRRKFIRHTAHVPLEVEQVGGSAAATERSVNVSHGGLAFLSATCPVVGDVVRVRIPTVDPPFEGRARVAWCRPEDDEFLVGVQFLDAADAFRSRMVQQVCSIENYRKEVEERAGRVLTPAEAAAEWISRYAGRFPDAETTSGDDGDSGG